MLKIYSAQHPSEAHLIKGILESYNIKSEVRSESIFSMRGELPLTPETAPSLWIFDDSSINDLVKISGWLW